MIIGYFGKEARHEISREERAQKEGEEGAKFVWFCGCGGGDMYPLHICRHLRTIFECAHRGKIPPELELTPEGAAAAAECECIQAAREHGPRRRPVPEGGELPSRRKPCPCGSGHKLKNCHGSPDGLPADALSWPGPLPLTEMRARLGLGPIEDAPPDRVRREVEHDYEPPRRRQLPEDWEEEEEPESAPPPPPPPPVKAPKLRLKLGKPKAPRKPKAAPPPPELGQSLEDYAKSLIAKLDPKAKARVRRAIFGK